ncbi:Uncharacterised protein [uncultured Clostridium sp.]|uniref:hypothetical protein n=1 Tax=uncultured Clostridium sp. TaxID=59620 RepID=UPI0008234823|nr:hypothetical protein [uncultured Clostridium sp.]SCI99018.1 Uncharacterised protein [uncultured Clostridium sp.]
MYKIKFNEYQQNVFNKVEFNGDKKRKLMSVYSYLIKYSDENNEVLKSLNKLHSMYNRYHIKISNKYFYDLVGILNDLKLILKQDKSIKIIQEKVQKEKHNETTEKTNVEGGFKKLNSEGEYNLYTNTNIVEMLKGFYKGISSKVNATKKDLKDIAKCLFVLNKVDNALVQHAVFSKIQNSKRNINLKGAVSYVEAIVMEKLGYYEAEYSL